MIGDWRRIYRLAVILLWSVRISFINWKRKRERESHWIFIEFDLDKAQFLEESTFLGLHMVKGKICGIHLLHHVRLEKKMLFRITYFLNSYREHSPVFPLSYMFSYLDNFQSFWNLSELPYLWTQILHVLRLPMTSYFPSFRPDISVKTHVPLHQSHPPCPRFFLFVPKRSAHIAFRDILMR